jgi:hypothetical protein
MIHIVYRSGIYNMAATYNFSVADFVIKKSDETEPIVCVITKIGLNSENVKEYTLSDINYDEKYLCCVEELILIMQDYDWVSEYENTLEIPNTQEFFEIRKAWHINTRNFLREQSKTQLLALVAKSEGEVAATSQPEASPLVETPAVHPPSGFEGSTQAIIAEMDKPFDFSEKPFEGSTQAIMEDLAKPLHFVDPNPDPYEGDTADILKELDIPFSSD